MKDDLASQLTELVVFNRVLATQCQSRLVGDQLQYLARQLYLEYHLFEFTNFAFQEVFNGVSLKVMFQADDVMQWMSYIQ